MKFLHALAMLALLSCQSAFFAQSLSPEENRALDMFIFAHLAEGETFSVGESQISLGGKEYFRIMPSSGGEFLAVRSPASKYGFGLVTDSNEAKAALSELYKSQGYNLSSLSEVPALKEHLSSFSKSREPGESKCKQYIGTDMYPCYDRESCYKSCFTPLCNPLALGGGWPFIDLIVSFENSTNNLGNLIGKGELAIGRLEFSNTKESLKSVSGIFSEINKEATAIKTNGLFIDYQLCYPIDYDIISLVRAKRLLEKIEGESLPLLELDSRSESFSSEARKRGADFSPEKIEQKISQSMPQVANAIIAENNSEKNGTGAKSQANGSIKPGDSAQNQGNQNEASYPRIPVISDLMDWIFSFFK